MADHATSGSRFRTASWEQSEPTGPRVDFDVRRPGRQLPGTEAPEGWIKKIQRRREGKVGVGFFHLWTTDANGQRVRTKKEKTLGPASMPKHEAQQKLAEYIEEYTGRLTKQGSSIRRMATTEVANLHRRLRALQSNGGWGFQLERQTIEQTCPAIMALRYDRGGAVESILDTLEILQNADGSWPAFIRDESEVVGQRRSSFLA